MGRTDLAIVTVFLWAAAERLPPCEQAGAEETIRLKEVAWRWPVENLESTKHS
jgi:hypothetical protein